MMEDAKTNYKERSGNLRKYKEEEKREIKEVRGEGEREIARARERSDLKWI